MCPYQPQAFKNVTTCQALRRKKLFFFHFFSWTSLFHVPKARLQNLSRKYSRYSGCKVSIKKDIAPKIDAPLKLSDYKATTQVADDSCTKHKCSRRCKGIDAETFAHTRVLWAPVDQSPNVYLCFVSPGICHFLWPKYLKQNERLSIRLKEKKHRSSTGSQGRLEDVQKLSLSPKNDVNFRL